MPFQSQAQWRWAFATDKPWAREWARMTPGGKRAFAKLRKRVGTKKALELLETQKHLPGKHDQRSHGRRGNRGGASGGGMTASEFAEWNDTANKQMYAEMLETHDRPMQVSSKSDHDRWIAAVMARVPESAQREFLLRLNTLDAIMGNGATVDEMIAILNTPEGLKAAQDMRFQSITDRAQRTMFVGQQYAYERAKRFSNMAQSEQDAVMQSILKIPAAERSGDQNEVLVTCALYGHPEMRMQAIADLSRNKHVLAPRSIETSELYSSKYVQIPTVFDATVFGGGPTGPMSTIEYFSLDYRLYAAQSLGRSSGYDDEGVRNTFIEKFTWTHSSENTSNVLGAAIQSAMSQVGPNADAPPAPSFYRPGIKPPEPHSTVVRYLNEQYEYTQERLRDAGQTSVQLYRGQRKDFKLGIPMGPWSEDKYVSVNFGDILNERDMPARFIFMTYTDPRFKTKYNSEDEYLILETAAMQGATARRVGTEDVSQTKKMPIYEWTGKSYEPRKDMPMILSSSESEYDIFYNYREKPKKRTKADETVDGKPRRYEARAGEVISGNLGRDASGRFTNVSGDGGRAEQRRVIRGAIKKPKRGAGKKPQQSPEEIKKVAQSTLEAAGVAPDTYDALSALSDEPIDFEEVKDNEGVKKLIEQGLLQNVDGVVTTTGDGEKLLKAAESGKKGRVKLAMARARQSVAKRTEQDQARATRQQERIDALDDRIGALEERLDAAKSDAAKKRISARIEKLRAKRDAISTKSSENKPTNPTLWKRAISEAKRRFNVYPSAYANAWAARWYKKQGGSWSSSKDLREWFKEDWVNIAKPIRQNGKIVSYEPCGRSDASDDAYPKCLPKAKAMRLTESQRQKLIARKRRAGMPKDGAPVMTSSKEYEFVIYQQVIV